MKTPEILIATRSAVLQQGLRALLESLPNDANVSAIRDLSRAYAWIAEHQPQIVLLDEELTGGNPQTALATIRSRSPRTRRALLADDIQASSLLGTHAEAVFIKGLPPAEIASTIIILLSTQGD